MTKLHRLLTIGLFYLAGCGQLADWQDKDQPDSINEIQQQAKSPDNTVDITVLPGTYYANIKHSSCRHLRVNIVFEVNQTYEKMVECMNNRSEPFYESGNWQLSENTLTLQSPRPLETTPEITHFVLKAKQLYLKNDLSGNILFRKQ